MLEAVKNLKVDKEWYASNYNQTWQTNNSWQNQNDTVLSRDRWAGGDTGRGGGKGKGKGGGVQVIRVIMSKSRCSGLSALYRVCQRGLSIYAPT